MDLKPLLKLVSLSLSLSLIIDSLLSYLSKPVKEAFISEAVINGGLVFPLVHLLQTSKFDLKKECAMAISNATIGCNKEQIKYLVTLGCTKPLSDLLKHENNEIYKKAVSILQTCRFEESDEP